MQAEIIPRSEQEFEEMKMARERVSVPATFISFKRSRRTVHVRYALLRIENVTTKEAAKMYLGHAVEMYIPKKNPQESGFNERIVRGYIHRVHGNSGVVRARFEKNLNPGFLGSLVYVKLYKANPNLFRF